MSMSQLAMDHDSAKQSAGDVLRSLRELVDVLRTEPADAYGRGCNDTACKVRAFIDVIQQEVDHGT